MWIIPSVRILNQIRDEGKNPVEGLAGIRNVIVHVLPFFDMCDKQDLGGLVDSKNTGAPTLYVYDRYSGGLGFAERAYEMIDDVMRACLTLIEECPCEEGCPSCVGIPNLFPGNHHDPDAMNGARPIPNKAVALMLLRAFLGEDAPEPAGE
jgi:DEAD/DEAH box helicase domain-containing protein